MSEPHEVLAALDALREMRQLRDTMLAQAKRLSHLVDVVTDVEPLLRGTATPRPRLERAAEAAE